jgi:[ribosomal protein S18]-alanine N-acetyltransferase
MNALLAPHVELLPMNLADIDEILDIEFRVYDFPWSRGNFAESMSSGYACWVCRVGGELVGYLVFMMVVDDAHLLNIGVAEKWQGKGFGARLLHHAMLNAGQSGALTLMLEVRPSNAAALALYRNFGFRQIGVRRAYYPAIKGREDALVLSHPLGEVLKVLA